MIFTYEDSWATSHAIKNSFILIFLPTSCTVQRFLLFLGAENSAKAKVNLLKAA